MVGDEFILSGWTPGKAKKPIGMFDIALTTKDGYFVGDVALRYWVPTLSPIEQSLYQSNTFWRRSRSTTGFSIRFYHVSIARGIA